MVTSPEVEQIGTNWGVSGYDSDRLSLLLRTQHLKDPTKGTDVRRSKYGAFSDAGRKRMTRT